MRKGFYCFLLLIIFLSTTGASLIDKETKEGVFGIDQKLTHFSAEQQNNHATTLRRLDEALQRQAEETTLLKEQSETLQKILQRLRGLETRVTSLAAPPAAVGQATPVAPVVIPPPPPTVRPEPVAPVVAPPARLTSPPEMPRKPIPARPEIPVTVSILALILSTFSLLFVAFLIGIKRGETRKGAPEPEIIPQTVVPPPPPIHKVHEVEGMNQGRPHLRIHANTEGIALVNDGGTEADEVSFLVGPTPSNMRQKLRVVSKIPVGERVDLHLQSHRPDDFLYATLEYKNPQTGRIYRDQFSLKVDRLTGELIPIQQAS